ncbi:MAG: YbhN family protein [Actinomycetota bacterium]|nr:YbhN family protein [Actinomycetota bacterium]
MQERTNAPGASGDVGSSVRGGHSTRRRVITGAVSLILVVVIFAYAIPRIASYGEVWSTVSTLTPLEFWSLLAATVFNLFTYWLANMAALPGLKLGQAAVVTQTTTSIANTVPAGGAVALGVTYKLLRSWGFTGSAIALYIGVTGIWNIFTKLALPVVSIAVLALTGGGSGAYVVAALIGLLVLGVAVVLLALVLWKESFARRVGDRLGRIASWFRKLAHREPVTDGADRAASFRADTKELVHRRWIAITLTTVLSQLALYFVLVLSLRHLGVSEQEVSAVEIFAVYAFGRLLTALPITPGGLGFVELGYIGGLVAAGGDKPQVVAAVLLFRALTYGIQIPLGAFTYMVWRAKSGWRSDEPPEGSIREHEHAAQAEPA